MYQVKFEGWEKVQRYLAKFPEITMRELKTAMSQSVITIANEVRPNVPVGVSSMLRNSIGSEVKQEGPTSIIGRVGSSISEAYPVVMEAGARPHFPPPQNLARWVHLKLGVPTEAALGVAFTISRAISRRGIKGRFFMKQAWERSQARVNDFFAKALTRIAEAINRGGS